MLVDDSEELTLIWAKLLKGAGYATSIFSDLQSACSALADGRSIEAVVCDQTLPDGDGLELLRQLRAISSEIPFLLMGGESDIELAARVERAGRARMLLKPLAFSQLLEAVIELRDGNRRS